MRELSESDADPKRHPVRTPVVTAFLFETYLSCPTKCFLLATGVAQSVNTYASWASERSRSYQDAGTKNLAARYDAKEITRDTPFDASSALRKSGLAINAVARVQKLETIFHAVEWGDEKRDGKLENAPIPIRFIPDNKLSRTDKLLLAFDAYVLSKILNRPVASGRIVHGDDFTTHKVKTSKAEREVKKIIGKITTLLSSADPPKLALNRHCAECVFQERCRKLAVEKDDLSLLPGLSEKERIKLNSKGIFSVTQLSYTFRPRRRSKRQVDRPEKYHHSLKALAIREKKIHIVGTPQLKIEGTPVFLDVEGLPDRDFYYLVGLRWLTENGVEQRSLWGDSPADEAQLWNDFCAVLSSIASPTLIHYGSFETTFFKKMSDRYGVPSEDSFVTGAIASAINLLSVIFGKIYFPTYSNGLKDIAANLGFSWNDPVASGLQSIAWRHEWGRTRDPALKDKLIRYNADDCEALSLVAGTTGKCGQKTPAHGGDTNADVVFADTPKKNATATGHVIHNSLGAILKLATEQYQHVKITLRPDGVDELRRPIGGVKGHAGATRIIPKPNRVKRVRRAIRCPKHKDQTLEKYSHEYHRTVIDLVITKNGYKKLITKYVGYGGRCVHCSRIYIPPQLCKDYCLFGRNFRAWVVFQRIVLRLPYDAILLACEETFHERFSDSTIANFISGFSSEYEVTEKYLLKKILDSPFVHADETKINVQGNNQYVWVLTDGKHVVFRHTETREAAPIQEILKDYKGVLISDFYAAYDSFECRQQKCLVHLIRDLNDDLWKNPFMKELEDFVQAFKTLILPIMIDVQKYGLKRRNLRKHKSRVARFYKDAIDSHVYKNDIVRQYQKRFTRYQDSLFRFLDLDGIPWNNNMAERSIRHLAVQRKISGTVYKNHITPFLRLLGIAQSCRFQKKSFLAFLISKQMDIDQFRQKRRRSISRPVVPIVVGKNRERQFYSRTTTS